MISIFFLALGCQKGSITNNKKPAPIPKPTKGQAIIYLKQDCNVGNFVVTINGISKIIRNSSPSYVPSCDADSSFAIFPLDSGTYKFSAVGQQANSSGQTVTANGSVKVVANQCSGIMITCDGVKPIAMGNAGTPRFNLQHSSGVIFDLHVITPDGTEINPYNKSGKDGSMDLISNCIGNDLNPGIAGLTLTIQNIWFSQGVASHGTYKFWVQYSLDCGNVPVNGNYNLRLMDGFYTSKTYSGTLTPTNTKSPVYTFTY